MIETKNMQNLQNRLPTWASIRRVSGIKELLFTYPQVANISLEEFNVIEKEWQTNPVQLEEQFNTDKRREFILSQLRNRIVRLDEKEKDLLKQYEQDRTNNVPFKERKGLMDKIELIKKTKSKDFATGKVVKESQFLKLDWIDPLLDREKIRETGFEVFFKKNWELSL